MRTIQFREAVCEAMSEEMRRDESIYLMGEEVAEYNGAYKASKGMLDEFGEKRVIDTPISELGFAGIGVGSTMTGNRPIIEFMTFNFALVGIDQIVNNAAKIRQMSGGQFPCPIVFRGPTASAGQLAATHSQAFESWYANCPGLKVIVPSNPYDAKGLLKSAIRDNDPVIFMESEQMYGDKGEVPEEEYLIPIGKADVKKTGKDVTVVSFGKIIKEVYAADQKLKENGVKIWDAWANENGDLGPVYGFQWRNWNNDNIDQISQLIDTVKNNPDSRRMLISAWNPSVLPETNKTFSENVKLGNAALPPCHAFFQFYVANNKLSCQLYQRSADIFLGVPFNIASYALLTEMIAHVCNLQAGDFVHTFGDAHIYKDHFEQMELQLKREPRTLPELKINKNVESIFDFKFEDFEVINYDPHPHIKGKVSV